MPKIVSASLTYREDHCELQIRGWDLPSAVYPVPLGRHLVPADVIRACGADPLLRLAGALTWAAQQDPPRR